MEKSFLITSSSMAAATDCGRRMNDGTNERTNSSLCRSHQKRMYFLLSSTAKDLWPPLFLLAAPAPAPAACLLIAGKETTERKKERKGKKYGNRAADSMEEERRGEEGEGRGSKGVRSPSKVARVTKRRLKTQK